MLRLAASRAPNARFVKGDAFELPFPPAAFDRLVAGHFYGHLEETDRMRFLAESCRVASELVVVDAAPPDDVPAISWQDRVLNQGSRWQIYKRHFEPDLLLQEMGGGDVLFAGRWFVAIRASLRP
jgi:ubiquinone/menaquinone biosynthesis C-methylase UbiE